MFLMFAAIVLGIQSVSATEVCVEGYVMDLYCIDRGTLLDNPSVKTLEEPEKHSVHCLVDVPRCVKSDFNILLPNDKPGPKYARALVLDNAGKDMAVKLARRSGKPGGCSTCNGEGTLTHGFRATFIGKVVKDRVPALFVTTNVTMSPKLFDSNAKSDGCPAGMAKLNLTLTTKSGGDKVPSLAHGSLMIIGWGFLLPTGVASAHFLKHRPNALWFKAHRIMQIFGLVVAICGWAVALANFDVFTIVDRSYTHGALGMTVMALGIFQPINAFIRPHPPEKGASRPLKRLVWEIVHKCSGYIAIIMAAVTICYGTIVIFDHNSAFRAAWGATIGWVILFSLACAWDGYRFKQANLTAPSKSDATKSQNDL